MCSLTNKKSQKKTKNMRWLVETRVQIFTFIPVKCGTLIPTLRVFYFVHLLYTNSATFTVN